MDAKGEQLLGWLASRDGSTSVEALTARILDAYSADGVGLAGPLSSPFPPVLAQWKQSADRAYPWLEESGKPATTRVIQKETHTWLVAPLEGPSGGGILAWIAAPAGREFSEDEKRLLPAVGLLLWQALGKIQPTHSWLTAVRQSRCVDQLEQAARLTGKLAHDIGNLLTGVLGFAELSLGQVTPPSVLHQFLSEVVEAAQQGAAWVHKLQTFSRRLKPQKQTCDFAAILAEEEKRVRLAWQKFALLTVRQPEKLPPVEMEATAVQTVLAQVLDNAREALAEPGTVTLTARQVHLEEPTNILGRPRPGHFLEVTVTDTGRGLPELLAQGKIDEMFIRSRGRQRGLGLAVVYGILTNHGGGIAFAPLTNGGAGVRLYLPLVEGPLQLETTRERGRSNKPGAEASTGG